MNSAHPSEISGSEQASEPSLYPTTRCASAPDLPPTESSERIQREFCSAYYRLNCLYARLQEIRRGPDGAKPGAERETLLAIEENLRGRDELEDRYAPYGVIAEAIAQEGFTREIRFTFGDRNVLRWQRTRLVSSTAVLFFDDVDDSASASAANL